MPVSMTATVTPCPLMLGKAVSAASCSIRCGAAPHVTAVSRRRGSSGSQAKRDGAVRVLNIRVLDIGADRTQQENALRAGSFRVLPDLSSDKDDRAGWAVQHAADPAESKSVG